MLEGLYSAAAGVSAQQEQLDAISNDLANVNTTGYKPERVAFNDLLYNNVRVSGTETTAGAGANAAIIGRGSAEGGLQQTGNPLDVAIEGPGFIEVTTPGGEPALTRDGSLAVDASRTLVTAAGDRLSPQIKLPEGVSAGEVSIARDGTVTAAGKTLGRIKLVEVPSPAHLLSLGGNLFAPTAASGAPGAASEAKLHQGALEGSGVDMGAEMADLVSTQRAFQMDSSAIQLESQMMTIANELRA
jgi:flagellar basal-body rod protein FlgG